MSAIDTSSSPRNDITIAGKVFSVPAPFVEGHVLRPNEAAVLNQTYAENIRNNFAATVKEAIEKDAKGEAPFDTVALQTELDSYINEYDFGVRRAGETRVAVDPVTREARSIALAKIKASLKKKGIKAADLDKDQLKSMVDGALQKYPQIVEQARKIVEAKKAAGAESLDLEI